MNVFELWATINLKSDDYKRELHEAENESGKAADNISQRSVAMGTAIGNLLSRGITMVAGYAKQAVATGVEYNAQIEKYTVALTTALGNEAEAARAIEQIKKDAAATPYSVNGLVSANSYLISAGESADDARKTIMALTDAISATSGGNEELSRMALNLQQVKNQGKAAAVDIKQFAMAGIPVYQLLADYLGVSVDQTKELEISYEDLTGALQHASEEGGRFFEANIKQSQTMMGQYSTLQDNIKQKLGEAFSAVSETIRTDVLPAANQMVSSFDATKVSESLSKVIPILLKIGEGALGVVENIDALTPPLLAFGATMAAIKVTQNIAKWSSAFSSFFSLLASNPFALAIGGLTLIGKVIYDDIKATQELKINTDELRSSLEGLVPQEEVDRAVELADRISELRIRIKNSETELMQAGQGSGVNTERLRESIEVYKAELSGLEEELDAVKATAENTGEAIGESLADGVDAAAESVVTFESLMDEVTNKYVETYESVLKGVKGWVGAFDYAKESATTSVGEMMAAMQSQIDFNNSYAANLEKLRSYDLPYLAEALQGMGAEGAAYAQAMVEAVEAAGGATSAGGQAVIQSFNEMSSEVEASQQEVANSLTDLTGEFEAAYAQIIRTAGDGVSEMDKSAEAAAAGVNTINAYIDALAGGAGAVYQSAAYIASQAAAGLGYAQQQRRRGQGAGGAVAVPMLDVGSDYIPYDNYPALLHKGEMVVPAKISEDLRDFVGAGGQPQTMNGDGIKEVVALLTAILNKDTGIYIDGREIGRTSANYNWEEARAFG